MKTCKTGCGKMKSGGTIKKVKKMAKGGQALNKAHGYAKAAMGGTNTEMGIYGVPNAGPTGNNRTAGYSYKKGGTTKNAKLAAMAAPKNKITRADIITAIKKKAKKK